MLFFPELLVLQLLYDTIGAQAPSPNVISVGSRLLCTMLGGSLEYIP